MGVIKERECKEDFKSFKLMWRTPEKRGKKAIFLRWMYFLCFILSAPHHSPIREIRGMKAVGSDSMDPIVLFGVQKQFLTHLFYPVIIKKRGLSWGTRFIESLVTESAQRDTFCDAITSTDTHLIYRSVIVQLEMQRRQKNGHFTSISTEVTSGSSLDLGRHPRSMYLVFLCVLPSQEEAGTTFQGEKRPNIRPSRGEWLVTYKNFWTLIPRILWVQVVDEAY